MTDFAIVIGICYPHLRPLKGTVKDAFAFYKWLRKTAKVERQNVHLLVSNASKDYPNPTQDEIDNTFSKVFKQAKTSNPRRLYIYFAGHGAAANAGKLALLMPDASPETLNRSLQTDSYHQWLREQALFPEQLFFYDCCYTYDLRVDGRICPFTKPKDWKPTSQTASALQYFFYGSAFTQSAYEEKTSSFSTKRGLFTIALIEGLGGEAVERKIKRQKNQWLVTTRSLRRYITTRLKDLNDRFGRNQKLDPDAGAGENLELFKIDKSTLKRHDLTVITHTKEGEVIVYDEHEREVERQPLPDKEITFKLPSGLYTLTIELGENVIEESAIEIMPKRKNKISL